MRTFTPLPLPLQAGAVTTSGISVTLVIALVLGVGVGLPVLACCVYQAALLVRLCVRPKAEPLKEAPTGGHKQELSEADFRRAMELDPHVQECLSDTATVAAPEPSSPLAWAATLLPTAPVLPLLGFGLVGAGAAAASSGGETRGENAGKPTDGYDLTMGLGFGGGGGDGEGEGDVDDKEVEVGDDDDVRSATSVPPADGGFNSNWFTNPFWSRRQQDSF